MRDETVVPLLERVDLGAGDGDAEVVVVSDIHFGAEDWHGEQWARDKAYILRQDPARCRLLLLGDIFQFDTKFQKHSGVYQQALTPDEQADQAVEELAPLVPYCDLLLAGNHDNRLIAEVGYDATKQLASRLGLRDRYVRDNAVVQYSLGETHRNRPVIYSIYAYHGDGNGQSRASLERAGNLCLADAYVSGHTHDPLIFTDRIYLPHPQTQSMTYRDRLYLATGAYQLGRGYALRKNYRPRRYGMGRLYLSATERRIEGRL